MTAKKRLGLSISIHLYQRLQKKAEYQGKTLNALCNDILWKYFEQEESYKDNMAYQIAMGEINIEKDIG